MLAGILIYWPRIIAVAVVLGFLGVLALVQHQRNVQLNQKVIHLTEIVEGTPGPEGEPGLIGKAGKLGPQGPQGTKGSTGRRGPEGRRGPAGERGPAGSRGEQGRPGTTVTQAQIARMVADFIRGHKLVCTVTSKPNATVLTLSCKVP